MTNDNGVTRAGEIWLIATSTDIPFVQVDVPLYWSNCLAYNSCNMECYSMEFSNVCCSIHSIFIRCY